MLFTFIAHKIYIFLLHNSQKYTTFALELKQSVTIAIKLKPTPMKMNVSTMKQQTQDFVLRLFVESPGLFSTPSRSQFYTCSHVGTHARLHQ